MANLVIQDQFREALLNGAHNFDSGTYKVALSNTAIASDDDYGDITEIANGNGYTTGGPTLTPTVSGDATSAEVAFADATVTASGAGMATWRYGLIYNSGSGAAVCRFDAGSAQSLAAGDSRTLDFSTFAYRIEA